MVTISENFSKWLDDKFSRALSNLRVELLKEFGDSIISIVVSRSRSGKDYDGASFSPLSPQYIKARRKMKLHNSTSASTSNITQTGKMLDSLTYKINGWSLVITFASNTEAEKAEYVSKDRPFMGLTDNDIEKLEMRIAELLSKSLNE